MTTVVDAEGEPMRLALRAEPDVVSPNVLEAEELVGHEFNDEQDRVVAGRELLELGPREAIITLPDGCVAQRARRRAPGAAPRAASTRARPCATIGAGDAFLAGYVAARYAGSSPEECLRFGVACGAESTQRLGAGMVDPQGVERLLGEVDLGPVEASTGAV